LFKSAEEFMRLLELDLRSRPSQPGVRWVSRGVTPLDGRR